MVAIWLLIGCRLILYALSPTNQLQLITQLRISSNHNQFNPTLSLTSTTHTHTHLHTWSLTRALTRTPNTPNKLTSDTLTHSQSTHIHTHTHTYIPTHTHSTQTINQSIRAGFLPTYSLSFTLACYGVVMACGVASPTTA